MNKRLKLAFIIIIHLIVLSTFQFPKGNSKERNNNQDGSKKIPKSLINIISLDIKNIPFEEALLTIAKKGRFKLNYKRSTLPVHEKVTLKMNNVTAIKALHKILKNTRSELKIINGEHFVIVPKKNKKSRLGTISGKIEESMINRPIPGVLIQIVNKNFSTISDQSGKYDIFKVPVGSYNIRFSADGFKTAVKTDVMVRPGRITYIDAKLDEQPLHTNETVDVFASYFHKNKKNPVSVVNISAEEVRRAPGTAGDLSRMLKSLPGVASTMDGTDELIVRGGAPLENGFYLDNFEVPLISHIPWNGTSGGFWSAVDQDLIQNVDFFSGAFSSNYGDRLSSITEITLREGNRNEFDGQFNLNLIQFGGVLEGPIVKGRGSWLISFRKSLIDSAVDLGILKLDNEGFPETIDTQMKFTYDITSKHKLNTLYFHGQGNFIEHSTHNFTNPMKYKQHTIGLNWVSTWNEKFFSNTSLAFSSLYRFYGEDLPGLPDGEDIWTVDDQARYINLKNSNVLSLNNSNKLEFGLQLKHEFQSLDHLIFIDENSNRIPTIARNGDFSTTKYSLFFTYISKPFSRLIMSLGLRGDYSSAHNVFHLAPRFSLSYQVNDKFSLNGGFGIFYQTIPLNYLAYVPAAVNVKDMKAIHYLLGLKYFSGVGTKLSLEAYYKEYKHLPSSPDLPYALVTDWILESTFHNSDYEISGYLIPTSFDHNGISGYSSGAEIFIQQKLVKRFYCILNATIFRSRYKDLFGTLRNRIFDNRYLLNLVLGWKPSRRWEFSARWTMRGGAPYTPTDIVQSDLSGKWVLNRSRTNEARYPNYNSLNLRLDKRWFFGKTSLILYVDVWNVFGRENIRYYVWDPYSRQMEAKYQVETFPIFGMEFEF